MRQNQVRQKKNNHKKRKWVGSGIEWVGGLVEGKSGCVTGVQFSVLLMWLNNTSLSLSLSLSFLFLFKTLMSFSSSAAAVVALLFKEETRLRHESFWLWKAKWCQPFNQTIDTWLVLDHRILTNIAWGCFNAQLTSSSVVSGLESAALLHWNYRHIYLFVWIQNQQNNNVHPVFGILT